MAGFGLPSYRSVRLSACPPVRLSACPPVRLSACPPVRLPAYPPIHPPRPGRLPHSGPPMRVAGRSIRRFDPPVRHLGRESNQWNLDPAVTIERADRDEWAAVTGPKRF